MNRQEIAERIKAFLEEEFPSQDVALTNTTHLLDGWFMDSLGIVVTVLFLESNFKIKFSRADINGEAFASIDSLTDLVASRLPPPQAG